MGEEENSARLFMLLAPLCFQDRSETKRAEDMSSINLAANENDQPDSEKLQKDHPVMPLSLTGNQHCQRPATPDQ